ncbi:hypothetical protein Leryth_006797 [Lithospermum erythrorhizon]|nr:hypothetical protein Leryth_006797 [Lithospermum erythrorhizon]
MYPHLDDPNAGTTHQPSSSTSSIYPTIDMHDDEVENTSSESDKDAPDCPYDPPIPEDDTVLTVPGAILHLIDKQYSVELAIGDFVIHSIRQGDNTIAVLACVNKEIQWPLSKEVAVVKLDDSHYFFAFRAPQGSEGDSSDDEDDCKAKEKSKKSKKKAKEGKELDNDVLNYGLTIVLKGQDSLLKELDEVLEHCSSFSVHRVVKKGDAEVLDAIEGSPGDLNSEKERCAAYWTTLAPNVEEYSTVAAKLIAAGSGRLIQGILWCGDVTSDRLKWGNDILKKRISPVEKYDINPETLKRIKRVKKVSKMTEKVATGVLSGVVKVSGFFTSSIANSKMGKKFFALLPGEVVLASLEGFSKIGDAVEIAGKNVMTTSSTVTTGLVQHRYGEEAAKATSQGLYAAGHAVGAAWAVFKIRQALNPKAILKPTELAKFSKHAEKKVKKSKKQLKLAN